MLFGIAGLVHLMFKGENHTKVIFKGEGGGGPKVGLWLDVYRLIPFKSTLMIEATKHISLIPVWMTSTFI